MRIKWPRLGDVLIAGSVLLIAALSAISGASSPEGVQRGWDALGYTLMVAQVLPLLWRQQAPRVVAWTTSGVWIVIQGLGYPDSLAVIAPFIAIYGLAAYTPRRTAYKHAAVMGGILLAWTAVGVFAADLADITALVTVAFGVILPFALGFIEHARAENLAELERTHARQEEAKAAAAREAVNSERARIARELHDVVAHEMTVMTLQAEGARRLAANTDPRLTEALSTIAASGRSGLAEMQRMIAVLRETEEADSQGLTPAPSIRDIPSLVRQVREAGMPVRLSMTGDAPMPAGVELNAFRIVQEGLTNALKYAGPGASATVEVQRLPDEVRITVRDDGRGAAAESGSTGGHGVVGMRERVEALGGTLDAGPAKGGGYVVKAVLPTARRSGESKPKRTIGILTGGNG